MRRLLTFALALPLASLSAQTWTLVEEQRFQDEDRAPMSRPGVLTVLPGGGVVLVDYPEKSLVRYSAGGRFEARIGRAGQGPGEFESPGLIGRIGDTIWVADPTLQRVTFFGPDSKLVRTSTYRLTAPGFGPVPGIPLAILQGGGAVGLPGMAARPDGYPAVPVLHVRANSDRSDTLEVLSMTSGSGAIRTGNGIMQFVQPLDGGPRVFAVPGGQGVVIADFSNAVSRESARVPMARYGPDGRRRWRRAWQYAPEPVTDAQFDSVANAFTDQRPPSVSRDQLRGAIRRQKFWAPFIGGFVAEDGGIWLAERDRGRTRSYRVFTSDGAPAASVNVPAGAILRHATPTHVYGWITEDEIPVLFRWCIVKGR